MKKHFLFSTMFALTTALSYGQAITATTGSAPTPVTCTDDALHPIIGKEYTYKGTGTPTGGTYHIFATNSTNFITNGALNTTGAYTSGNQITTTDANYNVGTNNNGEAKLSWSGAAANPSFVVVQYKAPIGACTTDNLKVYKIEPKNAFTIELRNMEKGTGNTFTTKTTNVDVCSGAVKEATYNTGLDKMEYNYGSQSFFYELIAANYDNKTFEAKFKLSGLDTNQSAKLKWGVDKTAINNDLGNIISGGAEVSVTVTADASVNPSAGVSIYLELVVENGSYEGITDKNITLSADATTGTGANKLKDVKADCTEEGDFADTATQTLIKRPTINPNTGLNFIAQ
jgi:hypothetical protein